MLKKIAPDKWKHFFVGIGMGIVLQAFASFLLKDHLIIASIIAFTLILIISYGFELFSKFTGIGHYDFVDAIAGAIGGVLGMGGVLAIQLLF
jgi:VanZ family protein